jgi:hypothetical protein
VVKSTDGVMFIVCIDENRENDEDCYIIRITKNDSTSKINGAKIFTISRILKSS